MFICVVLSAGYTKLMVEIIFLETTLTLFVLSFALLALLFGNTTIYLKAVLVLSALLLSITLPVGLSALGMARFHYFTPVNILAGLSALLTRVLWACVKVVGDLGQLPQVVLLISSILQDIRYLTFYKTKI